MANIGGGTQLIWETTPKRHLALSNYDDDDDGDDDEEEESKHQ